MTNTAFTAKLKNAIDEALPHPDTLTAKQISVAVSKARSIGEALGVDTDHSQLTVGGLRGRAKCYNEAVDALMKVIEAPLPENPSRENLSTHLDDKRKALAKLDAALKAANGETRQGFPYKGPGLYGL